MVFLARPIENENGHPDEVFPITTPCWCCGKKLFGPTIRYDTLEGFHYMHLNCADTMVYRIALDLRKHRSEYGDELNVKPWW